MSENKLFFLSLCDFTKNSHSGIVTGVTLLFAWVMLGRLIDLLLELLWLVWVVLAVSAMCYLPAIKVYKHHRGSSPLKNILSKRHDNGFSSNKNISNLFVDLNKKFKGKHKTKMEPNSNVQNIDKEAGNQHCKEEVQLSSKPIAIQQNKNNLADIAKGIQESVRDKLEPISNVQNNDKEAGNQHRKEVHLSSKPNSIQQNQNNLADTAKGIQESVRDKIGLFATNNKSQPNNFAVRK